MELVDSCSCCVYSDKCIQVVNDHNMHMCCPKATTRHSSRLVQCALAKFVDTLFVTGRFKSESEFSVDC